MYGVNFNFNKAVLMFLLAKVSLHLKFSFTFTPFFLKHMTWHKFIFKLEKGASGWWEMKAGLLGDQHKCILFQEEGMSNKKKSQTEKKKTQPPL